VVAFVYELALIVMVLYAANKSLNAVKSATSVSFRDRGRAVEQWMTFWIACALCSLVDMMVGTLFAQAVLYYFLKGAILWYLVSCAQDEKVRFRVDGYVATLVFMTETWYGRSLDWLSKKVTHPFLASLFSKVYQREARSTSEAPRLTSILKNADPSGVRTVRLDEIIREVRHVE